MKTPTQSTLQLDAILQGLLIIPMLIFYSPYLVGAESENLIIGLFLQFFLGLLQLISASTRVARHQCKIREKYLSVAIPYVVFLVIAGNIGSPLVNKVSIIIFMFIIPCCIALWYWRLTILQATGKLKKVENFDLDFISTNHMNTEQDDMLIEDILQRHQKRCKQSR